MAKKHQTIHEVTHPLLLHKISHMRRPVKDCPSRLFVQLMREAGMIMASEVMRDFAMGTKKIHTQRAQKEGHAGTYAGAVLKNKKPVIVPILRSGLVMAEGVQEVISTTYTGHIGIFHPPGTAEANAYLVSLPEKVDPNSEEWQPEEDDEGFAAELGNRQIFLIDPVIVSGKTASLAVNILTEMGIAKSHIHFLTLILGVDGEEELLDKHADMHIHTAIRGEEVRNNDLDPGLGLISNRLFRTV